jgi:hypothetical protein
MNEQQPTPRACSTCGGACGYPETTPTPTGHTTTWRTCTSCGGTGTQAGGI